MIRKILLAYDGSDNARRALDVAAELSDKLGAGLRIVHVLMHGRPAAELVRMAEVEHIVAETQKVLTPGAPDTARTPFEMLGGGGHDDNTARVISALGDQLLVYARNRAKELGAKAITTSALDGDYADKILDAADEAKADLIVVGSRGLGTVRGMILGSVSQKVLHHAEQTVVAVK